MSPKDQKSANLSGADRQRLPGRFTFEFFLLGVVAGRVMADALLTFRCSTRQRGAFEVSLRRGERVGVVGKNGEDGGGRRQEERVVKEKMRRREEGITVFRRDRLSKY